MHDPQGNPVPRVLSLVKGMWGGIGKYAATLHELSRHTDLQLRSVVLNDPRWPCHRETLNASGMEELVVRGRGDLSWLTKCAAIVREYRPHLLFVHGFNGPVLACLLRWKTRSRLPFVSSYHGEYYASQFRKAPLSVVYNGAQRIINKHRALSIVSVAEYSKQCLVRQGIAADKIQVVHNGLPLQRNPGRPAAEVRAQWGIGSDCTIIGALARLEPIKGLRYLLEGFQQLAAAKPAVRLIVAGNGPEEANLRALARRLAIEDKVSFLGLVEDVESVLNGLDLYVLPSLRENHSLGLIEAMRAGKSIVATDAGGNRESVRDGREGLIVPAQNASALAGAMKRLIDKPLLASDLARAARERFERHFTLPIMLDNTARWLIRCAEASPRFSNREPAS